MSSFEVVQHRETGEVRIIGDARARIGARSRAADGEWSVVIPWKVYRMGKYPLQDAAPIAAYMVPVDLRPGTRVWIPELIEDLAMEQHQGHVTFRASSAAVWTGEGFTLRADPADRIIG
jgi:hypothetical protein